MVKILMLFLGKIDMVKLPMFLYGNVCKTLLKIIKTLSTIIKTHGQTLSNIVKHIVNNHQKHGQQSLSKMVKHQQTRLSTLIKTHGQQSSTNVSLEEYTWKVVHLVLLFMLNILFL
jgi:hypothetical protein